LTRLASVGAWEMDGDHLAEAPSHALRIPVAAPCPPVVFDSAGTSHRS
jgi:hypothetical protein